MKTRQSVRHFSTGSFMPYIFISYSHDDAELVKKLTDRLQEAGLSQSLMCRLKSYLSGAGERKSLAMPYVPMEERLRARLLDHCRGAWRRGGTYCLDRIHRREDLRDR